MDDFMFASVRWVITAYHCVSSNLTTWEGTLQPADVRVILGLHTSFPFVFNVSSIFAAPNRQDVALLKIDGDIDIRYNENIIHQTTIPMFYLLPKPLVCSPLYVCHPPLTASTPWPLLPQDGASMCPPPTMTPPPPHLICSRSVFQVCKIWHFKCNEGNRVANPGPEQLWHLPQWWNWRPLLWDCSLYWGWGRQQGEKSYWTKI